MAKQSQSQLHLVNGPLLCSNTTGKLMWVTLCIFMKFIQSQFFNFHLFGRVLSEPLSKGPILCCLALSCRRNGGSDRLRVAHPGIHVLTGRCRYHRVSNRRQVWSDPFHMWRLTQLPLRFSDALSPEKNCSGKVK